MLPDRVQDVGAIVVCGWEGLLGDGGVPAKDAVPLPVLLCAYFTRLPDLHSLLQPHGVDDLLVSKVLENCILFRDVIVHVQIFFLFSLKLNQRIYF